MRDSLFSSALPRLRSYVYAKNRGVVAVVVLLAAAGIRLLVLDWTAPDLVRGGRPFLLHEIAPATVLHQSFEVTSGRLERVRLDGSAAGPPAHFDARLVKLLGGGHEWEVRSTADAMSLDSSECCVVAFEPGPDLGQGRYRLELAARGGEPSSRLTLSVVPARGDGELSINGHQQPSNLLFDIEGATLARLRGAHPIGLVPLLAFFAIADAALLAVLRRLHG